MFPRAIAADRMLKIFLLLAVGAEGEAQIRIVFRHREILISMKLFTAKNHQVLGENKNK